MKRIKFLPAGMLLFIVLSLHSVAPAADLDGLPVTGIILQDSHGNPLHDRDSLLPLLETRPGSPFSREAVRKSISYLYLGGKFHDVRVEAFPDKDGVRLVYTLFPVIIVERIVLRGNHSLPNRTILEAARGVEGKELREEGFSDIRANIRLQYEAEGYFNVRVNFRPEPSNEPHRAVLFIYIAEPRRTVTKEVRFKGTTVFSAQELTGTMKNRKGRPLRTSVLLEDDLESIRTLYTDAGYPAAVAGPVSMTFEDGRASVEIAVNEGPKVTVSFSGNRLFCARQFPDTLQFDPDRGGSELVLDEACEKYFRDLLLIWSEHEVSDAIIESSMDKIRNTYQEQGYPDVKVAVKKKESPGSLDLAFTIDEGQRVMVAGVNVEGSRNITARQIKALLETREPGWLGMHLYREDVLEKDVDLISDQYVAAGFLAASVKKTVTRSVEGSTAVIDLKISEGRQTLTGHISFEGNTALTADDISDGLKLKPSAPFSDRFLEEDRYRILSLYSARGYLYTRVEVEKKPAFESGPPDKNGKGADAGGAPEVLNIRFRIIEDQRVSIGKVILRGNVATRDQVILRELEPRTGEPYNYESLLKSQQRVYRYGYFSMAKFEPVHPNEKEVTKDMLFTIEERPAGAVEFGVGYGTLDRLRGFVEVSHRNILGTARYASLRFEASDILERTAFMLKEPWFMGQRDLESKFLLIWSNAKRINEQTREVYYQTRKTSASYGVEKTIESLKVSLTYQFENVENYNVQPAAELSPDDSGWVRISSLNPSVILDKRDDPFNPSRGGVHGLNVKQAMNIIGSKADFTKVTVQSTWFYSLAERRIIALSGRAGMGWPHRDTMEIPIHERFYLGGSTTVRGFIQDSVGPYNLDASGDRIPTGGSSMVQLNAELRLNTAEGGGVVFFTDAGNVWVDQSIRLDDLRASYGMGLRYHTPVGPLRLDYGQKIHRRTGESPGELHFTIGHAF